jgi:protein-disulfide isomerase
MKGPSRPIAIAAAVWCLAASAFAGVMDPEPGDVALGRAAAPVTLIEYGSVGCSDCAEWRRTVFPTLKARYIDTGRVRFVLREMINGDPAVATAGFMLARCAGPAKYFQVVDAVFQRQPEMLVKSSKPGGVLGQIAKGVGMTDDAFEACIDDQKGLDALNARIAQHNKDKVDETPTFFVNGKRYDDLTLAQLPAALRPGRRS